jgi:homoserine dehydrogenase
VCPVAGIVANVNGATNVVQVQSESLGTSHLLGAGAGRFPTANSVVADMLAIRSGAGAAAAFPIPAAEGFVFDADYESRFYVRLNVRDQTGIIMTSGKLCHEHGVSIHAVLQNPIADPANVPFVVTTDVCRRSQVDRFCAAAAQEPWCLSPPLVMPLLD